MSDDQTPKPEPTPKPPLGRMIVERIDRSRCAACDIVLTDENRDRLIPTLCEPCAEGARNWLDDDDAF